MAAAAPVTSSMLVQMRDITSVTVAPDGGKAVVGLLSPDIESNELRLSWVIVSLSGAERPITVPGGNAMFDAEGLGARMDRRVVWSPGSERFFYLRLNEGETQLWSTDSKGAHTRQETHSNGDLFDIAPASDPNQLLVRAAPGRDVLVRAEREERRQGVLYDDELFPLAPPFDTFPSMGTVQLKRRTEKGSYYPVGWSGGVDGVFDIRRRTLATAVSSTDDALRSGRDDPRFGVSVTAAEAAAPRVWDDYRGLYVLTADAHGDQPAIRCEAPECFGHYLVVMGRHHGGSEVIFVSGGGSGGMNSRRPGTSRVFGWEPSTQRIRRIADFDGRFFNVQHFGSGEFRADRQLGRSIVGASEAPDQPPRLEVLDLESGRRRVVFDPNAELRGLTQGRTEWINWSTSVGTPGQGLLVLPDRFEPGRRYPLVITSYLCGGQMLRGGSGDNAPEFVLASRGIMSVCVSFPVAEVQRNYPLLTDLHRAYCDTLEGLLSDPRVSGMIDPARVGLSGQSFGANAGAYCISHSTHFTAAAFAHGSVLEPQTAQLFVTQQWDLARMQDPNSVFRMPHPWHDPEGRWNAASIAALAGRIDCPLLLQPDDTEYLASLPLFAALRAANRPVEMFVFPQETHQLYQPAHQFADRERQADWFDFWLQGREQASPDKQPQNLRWKRLRDLRDHARG